MKFKNRTGQNAKRGGRCLPNKVRRAEQQLAVAKPAFRRLERMGMTDEAKEENEVRRFNPLQLLRI